MFTFEEVDSLLYWLSGTQLTVLKMSLDIIVKLAERSYKISQSCDVFFEINKFETSSFGLTGSLQALAYGSEHIIYLLLPFRLHLRSLILQSSEKQLDISMQFLFFADKLAIASDHCICLSPVV